MKKIITILFFIICLFTISFASAKGEITIGGAIFKVDTLSRMKVAPGSYYSALKYSNENKTLRVFILEVDAKNPYIRFESAIGKDSTITTEGVSSMAIRKSKEGAVYFGGTNADFFDTSTTNLGYPCNGCMVEGQIARTPFNTSQMAFAGNQPFLDLMKFTKSTCTFGTKELVINDVNRPRGTNQLILYNNLNGKYTHTNMYGTEVLVKLLDGEGWGVNKKIKAQVVKIESGKGNMLMPENYAVLSGNGTAEELLKQINANDILELYLGLGFVNSTDSPQLNAMVGGDRMILQSGVVTDNDWAELHPRTSIGYSANRAKVIFCVVDGRSSLSVGTTTKQLADIMKSAGAYNAINLDGGGSSALYVKELGVVNNPSDGKERSVCNAIYAVNTAPTDSQLAEITANVCVASLPRYGVFNPVFYGYNKYGSLINTSVNGVKLSCNPEVGEINDKGEFVASGSANGTLYAEYNGLRTSIKIEKTLDAIPSLRLDSVLINKNAPYAVEVQALVGDKLLPLLSKALSWTVDNPTICSVEDGVIKGISNGKTMVYGKLGGSTLALKVTVEIPLRDVMPLLDNNDSSSWTIKNSSNIKSPTMIISDQVAKIKYTYAAGRAPYLQLINEMPMYSTPSAIKVVFNSGNIGLTKVVMTLRSNVATTYVAKEFANIEATKDYTAQVLMDEFLQDSKDLINYPIHFEGIKFMINSAAQVNGQEYELTIKELSLIYKDLNTNVGLTNPALMSKVRVYPNPVTGQQATLALVIDEPQNIRMELYSVAGNLLRNDNLGLCQTGEITLPLHGIPSGIYLLKVCMGSQCETIKITINN